MANLLIVNYKEITSESINELLRKIANVAMLVDWGFKNSQVKIKWRWEEEKQVAEFLTMLQEALDEPNIFMINEDKEASQEEVKDQNNYELEDLPEIQEDSTDKKIIPENESEAVVNLEPKISNEEALKLLLQYELSKYKFTPENSEEMATKFCSEFGIRGEALRLALSLASVAPSETEMYKLLSKALGKNSARIKLEVSAAFRRWMGNSYPDFLKAHADIKANDFLNIFREDVKKF